MSDAERTPSPFITELPEGPMMVSFLLERMIDLPAAESFEEAAAQEEALRRALENSGLMDSIPDDRRVMMTALAYYTAGTELDAIRNIRPEDV